MKRILLIEDDPDLRALVKKILEKTGYEVSDAPDGKTGLQLFRQEPYDLVITDIFMPQEDGIETIVDLKIQRSGVKIIAISGGGRWSQYGHKVSADEPLEIAKKVGADRILKKPVTIEFLVGMVADLLDQTHTSP